MSQYVNPASTSDISFTNALSFTINNDASAAVAENPFLELLGGDGVAPPNDDIVRTRFTQDSVNEISYFTHDRNRNGGGFNRITPTISIGLPNSTANFGAVLRWSGGTGAATLTELASLIHSSGVPCIQFDGQLSSRDTGSQSERFGELARATALNSLAQGYNANASAANTVADGPNSIANQAGATIVGASGTGAGANCTGVGSLVNITVASGIGIGRQVTVNAIGIMIAENATIQGANYFHIGSTALPITNMLMGRGDVFGGAHSLTWRMTNASGANIAGHPWDLNASQSTGSANGGRIRLSASPAGGAGSALNALATRFEVDGVGIGFFGIGPVARQAAPTPTLAEVVAALQAYGLLV